MKFLRRNLYPVTIAIAVLVAIFGLSNEKFVHEREGEEGEEEEEHCAGMVGQLESWWQQRAYPDPTYINDKWWAAWQHEQAMRNNDIISRNNNSGNSQDAARVTYGAWTSLGPNNGPGGRILTIAVRPGDPNTVYAGSASGGIWRSTNAAASWSVVPTGLPVLGVSSIIISSANNSVIYAGTGEVYRTNNSDIGYNVWKARGTYSIGILKSTDNGATWTQSLTRSTSALFGIQKLKFSNTSDNTVFACATDGLYRTTDAGVNWFNIAPGKILVTDVVINSANPDLMLIAVGNLVDADKGIYRTTNGTSATPTWTKLTNQVPTSTGFGGNVKFAYASGNTICASFSNLTGNSIRRSTDWGATWTTLANTDFNDIQFWCTNVMRVHPADPNILILGGVSMFRFTISTTNLAGIGGAVHSDFHDVAFDPSNSNTWYVGCDGGVWKTTNNGTGWTERNTGLGATQFYASLGVSSLTANFFVGGLQDNGSWRYNGSAWNKVSWLGGDGTASAIHPTNDNIQISSRDARGIARTANGSTGGAVTSYWGFVADSRTAFCAPLAFSKSNPNKVYCATDVLHVSTNAGASWSGDAATGGTPPTSPNNYIEGIHKTGIALAVSPTNENKLYVSTSPFAQYDNDVNNLYINPPPNVFRTSNANVASPTWTNIKSNLPDRFVMDFSIVPGFDDSVYAVLGGYGTSHIWVTGNGGTTWVSRGTGLPDVPFNCILVDPNDTRYIYAGSDMGVYVSNNLGVTWFSYSGGFTDVVQVFDLQRTFDNRLVAATHGRGVWITNLAYTSALPVNILEFSGLNRNTFNELKWKVADEKNVARYELERKVDNSSFTRVADISARNTGGITNYTYNDDIRVVSGTNYYYRLKMIDKDGTINYSSVVLIKVERPVGMEILGNPVNSGSAIRLTLSDAQRVVFKIYDSKGSLIKMTPVDASAGTNRFQFSIFGLLPAGHYTVETTLANNERYIKRIIVK